METLEIFQPQDCVWVPLKEKNKRNNNWVDSQVTWTTAKQHFLDSPV